MVTKNSQVPQRGAGARVGAGPATEQAPVDAPGSTLYITEKFAKNDPSLAITITSKQYVTVKTPIVETEIKTNVVVFRYTLIDAELVLDLSNNTATLRREGKLVATSNKIKCVDKVYETREFVELVKKRVKEMIEELTASVGI